MPALAAAILDAKRQLPLIVVTTTKYTDPDDIPQVATDEASIEINATSAHRVH